MKRRMVSLLICTILITGGSLMGADIKGEEVQYTGGGVTMKGYIAYDASITGKRPGMLVVHEWWGHNEYARKRARMLAELGYTALAVDMYGDGKQAAHPDEAGKFVDQILKDQASAQARFVAAMDRLKAEKTVDPTKIGAIGYCFGGGVVVEMARKGLPLAAVVSFHGNPATEKPAQPGTVKARILICHPGADEFTPQAAIDKFEAEMKAAKADYKVIVYPGVKHSFTNPDADALGKKFNLPLAYDAAADKKSWNDMQAFLKSAFGR